jgi:hypothetical protein
VAYIHTLQVQENRQRATMKEEDLNKNMNFSCSSRKSSAPPIYSGICIPVRRDGHRPGVGQMRGFVYHQA